MSQTRMLIHVLDDPRTWRAHSIDEPASWYDALSDDCLAAFGLLIERLHAQP